MGADERSVEDNWRLLVLLAAPDGRTRRTTYRKCAGQQLAQGMGWWFYDMAGGWFSAPEIVDDIRTALKGYDRVWSGTPSPWKPGVALVVDEAGPYGWAGGEGFLQRPLQFSHYEQLFLLARNACANSAPRSTLHGRSLRSGMKAKLAKLPRLKR